MQGISHVYGSNCLQGKMAPPNLYFLLNVRDSYIDSSILPQQHSCCADLSVLAPNLRERQCGNYSLWKEDSEMTKIRALVNSAVNLQWLWYEPLEKYAIIL